MYQHQGNILGFREILTNSILAPHNLNIKDLKVKSSPHSVMGIVGRDKLTMVEVVLRKL